MVIRYLYVAWILSLLFSAFWLQRFWPKKNVIEKYSFLTRVLVKLPGTFWRNYVDVEDLEYFKKFRKNWLFFWIYFVGSGVTLFFFSGRI